MVVTMVVHHSIDYFAPISMLSIYKYIRFVTGGYVFLSGYLVTQIYLPKYIGNRNIMVNRLMIRGLKLIILFVSINICGFLTKNLIRNQNLSFSSLVSYLYIILLAGSYERATFSILAPISYLLLGIGALFLFLKDGSKIIPSFSLCLIIFCSIAFYDNRGAYNLRYLTIGLCGATCGFWFSIISKWKIDVRKNLLKLFIVTLVLIGFLNTFKLYFPVYLSSTILILYWIYLVGTTWESNSWAKTGLYFLGRYSLLSYFSQIFILQLLKQLDLINNGELCSLAVAILIAGLGMVLIVMNVDWARKRWQIVEISYKLIFM